MVIPGVQADFMPGGLGLAHQVPQVTADRLARPGGAGQQDIPAIQAGSVGTQHLPQELRADQAPQVAPHIVRPDTEEKRRFYPGFIQGLEQPWHAFASATVSVDVDAKTCLHQRLSAISSMASRRKKSRVLPMVSLISTVGSQFSRRLAFSMLGLRWATS